MSSAPAGDYNHREAMSSNIAWLALQARAPKQSGSGITKSSQERYRLAGTFSLDDANEVVRKAIIDDTVKRDQSIVSEGQSLDDLIVEKIFFDHVVVRSPSGVHELWVDFAAHGMMTPNIAVSSTNSPASSGATNRFGCVRTQENRWRFNRKPILNYYQELLDEPDRMVAVFDTMKPVRDERNKITGYVVGLEGEKDFFDAVGLQQGDIVRTVNSVPMVNRRRAEAFIDQFLKDQMNAVVLEIERGGQTHKQVYQVQP